MFEILKGQVHAPSAYPVSKMLASLVLISSVFCAPLSAQVVQIPIASPEPEIESTAWALMDYESGWIVAGENVVQPLPPASITKLMTNYVVFEQLNSNSIHPAEMVAISEKAWRAEGSRMFADVNTAIPLEPLLKSTVIQSGNDASIALAEHIAGSEEGFAVMMNRTARKLGLLQSSFKNSTGLPADQHYMSVKDIAKLSAAIIRDYPNYYRWYSEKQYTHNGITQYNRNKLLWKDDSVDGLKTGYTDEAGFCLVGSALRSGHRWIAVVMGAKSAQARENSIREILNFGFANFEPLTVMDAGQTVSALPVFKGEQKAVNVVSSAPVKMVVPQGRQQDIIKEVSLPEFLEAPIQQGQIIGSLSVKLDNQELYNVPLISGAVVSEGGAWTVLKDTIQMKWNELLK